ncbi:MAG: FHA domain-containing protein [Anaerolineales bacterium]|nr:FHA domain-containing protein [Anaerolineales bacterium]
MNPNEIDTAKFKTSKLDIERLNQYFEKFEFTRLPARKDKITSEVAMRTWRIVLICLNAEKIPVPLEIFDDITIGRSHGDIQVDFDLTPYRGLEMGVSRLHARLHPTPDNLLIFDAGSTNGTFCNFKNATIIEPLPIANNDILTFGILNFQLKIVRHPKP